MFQTNERVEDGEGSRIRIFTLLRVTRVEKKSVFRVDRGFVVGRVETRVRSRGVFRLNSLSSLTLRDFV